MSSEIAVSRPPRTSSCVRMAPSSATPWFAGTRPCGIGPGPPAWWLCAATLLLVGAPEAERLRCEDPPPPRLAPGRVTSVIDGDTIRVQPSQGGLERVRLIGIDAPEVRPDPMLDRDAQRADRSRAAILAMGRRAAAFARRHLDRQTVGLELDVQPRDLYGRLLAYAWTSDGVLFNRLIVAEGYAQVMTVPPNVRYAALLRACEREAREARRGLWGD